MGGWGGRCTRPPCPLPGVAPPPPPPLTTHAHACLLQFTMEQRCGGRFDGYWYTRTLLAEGCAASNLYGVI